MKVLDALHVFIFYFSICVSLGSRSYDDYSAEKSFLLKSESTHANVCSRDLEGIVEQSVAECEITIPRVNRPNITEESSEKTLPQRVSIKKDKTVVISCEGLVILFGSERSLNPIEATCVSKAEFMVKGKPITVESLECVELEKSPILVRVTKKESSCAPNGKEIEIGLTYKKGEKSEFIPQIFICFDEKEQVPSYTIHEISKFIKRRETVDRPKFIEDKNIYDKVVVDKLYSKQYDTITTLLAITKADLQCITNSDTLTRGHLSPKGDFIYAPQQRATFHFVNIAPQWEMVNRGHWSRIEEDVRKYAEDNKVDLTVITGTYAKATLPNKNKEKTDLYLGPSNALPVPKYFWKVVYDLSHKRSVALVTLNRPYEQNEEEKDICEDISGEISWLGCKNCKRFYACSVDDFRKKVVTYLPKAYVDSELELLK